MMAELMPRTAGLRRPGAAALDLAYVAAGFADGFFESGLSPWDVAAGSLLVTEAGGLISNFSGEGDFLEQRECLAANPKIYAQLVTLLGKYSKFASVADKTSVRKTLTGRQSTAAAAAAKPPAGDAPF
jgi:myo-inositol-1(or 4)-monophosphatase